MIKIYVKVEDLKPTEKDETITGPNWDKKRQDWYDDMVENGIKEPIAIDSTGKILNGNLRYFFAKETATLPAEKTIEYLWVDSDYLQVSEDNAHLITKIKELRKQFKDLNKAYRAYRVRHPVDPPGK